MKRKIFQNTFPFLAEIRKYGRKKFQADIFAGFMVMVIAVPQSMAYAVVAGVSPIYGIYASIVPTIVASFFSRSRLLIFGPTNSVSLLVSSAVISATVAGAFSQNLSEEEKMAIIFLLAFLSGMIQIAFGFFRLGSLARFFSPSAMFGLMAGAGTLIFFSQLKAFFGIESFSGMGEFNPAAIFVGFITLALLFIFSKLFPRLPGSFLALGGACFSVFVFGLENSLDLVGEIPRSFPPLSLPAFEVGLAGALIFSALAIAVLGAAETYSISGAIFSRRKKDDLNRDLTAQGMANLSAGFFSGIPISASFTRSAISRHSAAATRFGGIFSGVMVLGAVLIFSPLIELVPMAALSGIIMAAAYLMIERPAFAFFRQCGFLKKAVFLTVFLGAVFLGLGQAVYLGIFLSAVSFWKNRRRSRR